MQFQKQAIRLILSGHIPHVMKLDLILLSRVFSSMPSFLKKVVKTTAVKWMSTGLCGSYIGCYVTMKSASSSCIVLVVQNFSVIIFFCTTTVQITIIICLLILMKNPSLYHLIWVGILIHLYAYLYCY